MWGLAVTSGLSPDHGELIAWEEYYNMDRRKRTQGLSQMLPLSGRDRQRAGKEGNHGKEGNLGYTSEFTLWFRTKNLVEYNEQFQPGPRPGGCLLVSAVSFLIELNRHTKKSCDLWGTM